MTNIQSDEKNAKINNELNKSKLDEHFQGLSSVLKKTAKEYGSLELVGMLCSQDSIEAEHRVADVMGDVGRSVLRDVFESLDPEESKIVVEGKSYRKVDPTPVRAYTLLGWVEFLRSRYRPSGLGEALFPVDDIIGLTSGNMTPAAAKISMYLMSHMTARESLETLKRFCGMGPSKASLVRLSSDAGNCMEESSDAVFKQLREQETIPSGATSILISLDGVMVRMIAEIANGKPKDAGWREASCGVVVLVDAKGEILKSRYFGRLPETGKQSLKSQLSAEVFHWLKIKPDLKLVAVADGARDNWEFLKELSPDVEILDYWHAAQHLQSAADAAFGAETKEGADWFKKYRHILRHDPAGIGKVIEAIRYRMTKGRGVKDLKKELTYFRNNRNRMNYAEAASAGFPIGSGTVEAANKVLVTARMKRSKQSWGRNGGQGVLTFRSLIKSDRFDRAWEILKPQMIRGVKWQPPQCANDNSSPQSIVLAALFGMDSKSEKM